MDCTINLFSHLTLAIVYQQNDCVNTRNTITTFTSRRNLIEQTLEYPKHVQHHVFPCLVKKTRVGVDGTLQVRALERSNYRADMLRGVGRHARNRHFLNLQSAGTTIII